MSRAASRSRGAPVLRAIWLNRWLPNSTSRTASSDQRSPTICSAAAIDPALIDDVIFGTVGQIGEQSANTARWAVLAAGLPESVPAVTAGRQCGKQPAGHPLRRAASHQRCLRSRHRLGGGVDERVPIGSQATGRTRSGPASPLVTREHPAGLVPQGVSAELIADRWQLSRQQFDTFAAAGHQRAATWRGRTVRGRYALQTMCEAGDLANATIIERL